MNSMLIEIMLSGFEKTDIGVKVSDMKGEIICLLELWDYYNNQP